MMEVEIVKQIAGAVTVVAFFAFMAFVVYLGTRS